MSTTVQVASKPGPDGNRSWRYLMSHTRLKLGMVLLAVWISGLYIGSNSRLNCQTVHLITGSGGQLLRQFLTTRNASVVSNSASRRGPFISPSLHGVSPNATKVLSSTDPARRVSTSQTHSLTTKTSSNTSADSCNFPEIDPFDPNIEKYLSRRPPINCSSYVPNVVHIDKDKLIIDSAKVKEALKKTKSNGTFGYCLYRVLQMKPNSDHHARVVTTSAKFDTSIKLKNTDEHIRVECYDTGDKVISRSYFAIIRRVDPERERAYNDSYKVHIDKNSPAETLSILMVGIDGFAKQHFARAMPKTREFLINELGALEMNKHSKLGYSTSPNVIPLLSGRTNEELIKDPKWKFQSRSWIDQINEAFVWSDARRVGYRTGLIFDQQYITAFHYLRKGFKRRPVDHYLRPTAVDSTGDSLMRKPSGKRCYGDEPEISKLCDYWLQLLHLYNSTRSNQTPFFAYSFLARLTHDNYNNAFAGDELYLKFLQDLKATNALNNTVLVWFSDHGERFGAIRHTFTGAIETNTPYLFFAFPPWFEKKYPDLMRVFRTNQNRLTSHYDTYATLQNLLNFKGVVGPKGKRGERSISFFREIPSDRTCKDAQIPAEYCLCSGLSAVKLTPGLDKYLGETVKDRVNGLVKSQKSKCATLKLGSVERILEEKEAANKSKSNTRNFRVSIMTEPGKGLFEARISFDVSKNKAKIVGDVMRTNMYRGQADCVDTPELRRYCYCKNLLKGAG